MMVEGVESQFAGLIAFSPQICLVLPGLLLMRLCMASQQKYASNDNFSANRKGFGPESSGVCRQGLFICKCIACGVGDLTEPIKPEDCYWDLADGKLLEINLQKQNTMQWWKGVLKSDPEICTQKVRAARPP